MKNHELIELIYTKVAKAYKVNRKDLLGYDKHVNQAKGAILSLMCSYMDYDYVADIFYITKSKIIAYLTKKQSDILYDLRYQRVQEEIYQEVFRDGYKFIA